MRKLLSLLGIIFILATAAFAAGPTITLISVASVTANSATITWTTSPAATTQVLYGIGNTNLSTPLNYSLVTSHSVLVTGLQQNTVYTYAVQSTNSGGSTTSSTNTFGLCNPGSQNTGLTNVTAQVNAGYATGTLTAVWTNDSGVSTSSPTSCGTTFPTTQTTTVGLPGNVNFQLPDNNYIVPSPGHWHFTLSNAVGFSKNQIVSGQSIDLTTLFGLQAAPAGAAAPVTSVFTRIGAVTAQSGDYTCAQVTGCPTTAYSWFGNTQNPLTTLIDPTTMVDASGSQINFGSGGLAFLDSTGTEVLSLSPSAGVSIDASPSTGFAYSGGPFGFTDGTNTIQSSASGIQIDTTPGLDITIQANPGTAPVPPASTLLDIYNANATASRLVVRSFGSTAFYSSAAYAGTLQTPTAVASNSQIGGWNAWAYDGTALGGPIAAFRVFANQNQAVGAHGSYADIATTPNGTTTEVEAIRFENDGGITVPATVTGGSKGAGTINVSGGYYVNGALLATGVSSVFGRTGAVVAATNDYNFNQLAGTWSTSQVPTGGSATAFLNGAGTYTTPTGVVPSVFGRTGAVVAATNDYNFNQLAGTLGTSQVPTGGSATAFLNGAGTYTAPTGAVLSVSNSDGTLTCSPTTGAVVCSIALGHANTWTGVQTFNLPPVVGSVGGTGGSTQYLGSSSGNVQPGCVPATTCGAFGSGSVPASFTKYNTTTNCGANGTAANPSVVSCGSAGAGSISCSASASGGTCTVNDTAVTANSNIILTSATYVGTRLAVTCNTAVITGDFVSAVSAGTSFTITLPVFTTNPECFTYQILN
jgi:hypothetical protein